MRRVQALIVEHKLERRVHFYEPQPHHLLSTFYRAAVLVWLHSKHPQVVCPLLQQVWVVCST
jgi:hypothetical protein